MEPFEIELKKALNRRTPMPAADAASLNDQIVHAYARKQRVLQNLTWAYLGAMTLALALFLWLFLNTSDLKLCMLYGIVILIVFEGTVLMKLWFWVMHSKIATVREIKQLQLYVAEAVSRQAAQGATARPETLAGPEPTSQAAPPAARARPRGPWRWLVGGAWLALVICLVYLLWGRRSDEPSQAQTYFTRTVSAAEAAAKPEWQETFEVREPRQRFHLRLRPGAAPSHLVVAVAPEGGEVMFRGPVENASRIYFGLNPSPGRYTVSVQSREGSAGYTLRILGVDDLPPVLSARVLLVMICSAFVFAIPVVWLQGRMLKRLDPGLARE